MLPSYFGSGTQELEPDAPWRKEAEKRIEQIRKGDFSVIVKDKNGNVIPNAEVEFDMFEHEYQFGASTNNKIYTNDEYAKKFATNIQMFIL